jgi:hypothetical protein
MQKENKMSFDALAELRAAGSRIDTLTDAQREVLRGLSPEEVSTLNAIKSRIDDAGPEVEGQKDISGGVIL